MFANFFRSVLKIFDSILEDCIRTKFLALAIIIVSAFNSSLAQKQLILLKRENVIHRMMPGDDFVFKKKENSAVITTYINNLSDTAVVTHRDTVPFHRIERIYFSRHTFLNTIGTVLVIGGAGIFLIDQFNTVVVRGDDFSLDDRVTNISVGSLTVGLPMMLIKKKSQAIRNRYRLLTVTESSPFYFNDKPKGYISPYIPRN